MCLDLKLVLVAFRNAAVDMRAATLPDCLRMLLIVAGLRRWRERGKGSYQLCELVGPDYSYVLKSGDAKVLVVVHLNCLAAVCGEMGHRQLCNDAIPKA
jgi:hypothetical protein